MRDRETLEDESRRRARPRRCRDIARPGPAAPRRPPPQAIATTPERRGQPERGRQVEPRSRQPVRQLNRARRGVEVDAEHQQRRAGDRRRADPHKRGGEGLRRRAVVRVASKSVGRHRRRAPASPPARPRRSRGRPRSSSSARRPRRASRSARPASRSRRSRERARTARSAAADIGRRGVTAKAASSPGRDRRPRRRTACPTAARRSGSSPATEAAAAIAPASRPQPSVAIMIGSGAR